MMIFLSNIAVILLMLLLLVMSCGAGMTLFRLFKLEFDEGAETIAFSFASGIILFSLLLLAMGKFGFFSGPYIIALTVIYFIFSLAGRKKFVSSFKAFFNDLKESGGLFILIIGIILAARLAIVFFSIFIPPTAGDSMAYHYAIPRLYLDAGKIFYIPFMYHSNWPEQMELVCGWGMALRGDLLANAASFLYGLMLLICLFAFGSTASNRRAGIIAAAIISSFYIFKADSTNGYVDTALAFFELASAYAVFKYMWTNKANYVFAAAICAAGAASIKILGLFSIAVLPLFLLFRDYLAGASDKKLRIKDAAVFVLASLLIASPWYIKSFVDTGNPVWPFAYSIFGGKNWSKELADFHNYYYAGHGAGRGIAQFLKLPVAMVSTAGMGGFMGNNIVFLYLSLPFVVYSVIRRKDRAQLFLLLYSFCFICFWAVNAQMTRFFFPGLAVITVMCAVETERILYGAYNGSPGTSIRHSSNYFSGWMISAKADKIFKIVFAGMLLYLLLYSFPLKNSLLGIKCFVGVVDRDNYLESTLDYYKLFEKINADNSIDGKIAFFREIRGYYLKKDYIWADPVNQGIISYKNTQQTLKQLNDNAVKYIIYNNNIYGDGQDGYSGTVYNIMNEIISKYSDQMYCYNGVCLYRLKIH